MKNYKGSGSTEGRSIFRRWRIGKFEYRSDLIAFDYMRRWMLKTPWFTLRLHHILRSDDDRAHHDHPMSFISWILRGGYIEYTPNNPPRRYLPGDVLVRRAEDLHFLKLIGDSAWTFLITTPFYRQWGFQTPDGWIPAHEYDEWKRKKDEAATLVSLGKDAIAAQKSKAN
jgi:hypothetical protein